jgi:hypothetical protein
VDDLTTTTGIVALAAAAVGLIALIVALVLAVKLKRVREAQTAVLGPHGSEDLVAHGQRLQHDFEALRAYVDDMAAGLDSRMEHAERRLDGAIAYRSLVRYDAYNEMSGRQSCSIALLDASRSGVVLTSIHHRDQARLYVKQVHDGAPELELSPEEAEAMRLALEGGAAPAAAG